MSRLFDDAALDAADYLAAVVSADPFTACAWVMSDAAGAHMAVSVGDKDVGSINYWALGQNADDPPNVRYEFDRNVIVDLETVATFALNEWHHIACQSLTASDHRVYLDGGNMAQSTQAEDAWANQDRTSIGASADSTRQYWSGRIAEVGIWNAALSAAEINALAKGVPPLLIRPGSLKGYWPLYGVGSPEQSVASRAPMTLTGTVVAPHPPVYSLRQYDQRLVYAAAAAAATSSQLLLDTYDLDAFEGVH